MKKNPQTNQKPKQMDLFVISNKYGLNNDNVNPSLIYTVMKNL